MTDDGGPAKDKSLRDEFAGLVMQGMYASETQGDGMMPSYDHQGSDTIELWFGRAAQRAYGQADAMLAERAKRERESK